MSTSWSDVLLENDATHQHRRQSHATRLTPAAAALELANAERKRVLYGHDAAVQPRDVPPRSNDEAVSLEHLRALVSRMDAQLKELVQFKCEAERADAAAAASAVAASAATDSTAAVCASPTTSGGYVPEGAASAAATGGVATSTTDAVLRKRIAAWEARAKRAEVALTEERHKNAKLEAENKQLTEYVRDERRRRAAEVPKRAAVPAASRTAATVVQQQTPPRRALTTPRTVHQPTDDAWVVLAAAEAALDAELETWRADFAAASSSHTFVTADAREVQKVTAEDEAFEHAHG